MKFRARVFLVVGSIFFVLGVVFLFSGFSGMTGYVVFDSLEDRESFFFALLFFLAGIGMFMSRAKLNRYAGGIAASVYENLARHDAYGHHTESVSIVEARVAGSRFSRKDVGHVIKDEIRCGRLVLDKSHTAVSLPTSPAKIEEILHEYGNRMDISVRDRLSELSHRRLPSGSR